MAASSAFRKGGNVVDSPPSQPARPKSITWLIPGSAKKELIHARKTESARSVGRRSVGSMKMPGMGGADRREIVPILELSTLLDAVAAVMRAPCEGNSVGVVDDSWGSSNNESGLSSPSFGVSASSEVSARG